MDGIEQIRAAVAAAEPIAPPEVPAAPDQGQDRGADWEPDWGAPPDDLPPAPEAPEIAAAAFPLNDYGNGQRVIHYFGEDMRFVPRLGWYRWTGQRWLADEDELKVRRDAQHIAQKILGEVDHIALEPFERDALDLGRDTAAQLRELERKKPDERDEKEAARLAELREIAGRASEISAAFRKRKASHRAHAKNSGNTSKISNMLQEARTFTACSINDLNADPLAVNVNNGTLHFHMDLDPHDAEWGVRTPVWQVELRDHCREDLISKMMPVDYDPNATCPAWRQFLSVVQPDPDMQDFLQRWVGYCMTGKTSEQKMVFNFGQGRNGKSTFVEALARIFADYGTTVPIETLTGTEQRKGSDATPDLVRLPGARFVRASEPDQGTRMKEALIKALTGGEAIMIRRMMQEFVEVIPEFKLMISGNHKPEIRGADDGIWRRVLLVPWAVQIDKADVDPGLPEKLQAEAPGILAWMVRGCLKYLQTGLEEPAAVREATDEYRQESDKLRLFLQTECKITGSADDFEKGRDLADAFNGWLLDRGDAVWGRRQIAKELKAREGVVQGPMGQQFSWKKRSDSGYGGILLTQAALNRIAVYGDEIRAGAARKG